MAPVTAGLAETGVAVSQQGQGSLCGGLSQPVPTAHADVPPHRTDPSPAPIRGLSELKQRRADQGRCLPFRGGQVPHSPALKKEAQLSWGAGPSTGCKAVADPSVSDAVSVLPVLLHVTEDCALKLPWPEQ